MIDINVVFSKKMNGKSKSTMDSLIPKRLVVVGLCCLGMAVVHAIRLNFTITMITIVDKAPQNKVKTISAITNLPDASWKSVRIGYLRAMFYLGLLVTQIPGGFLTTKFPAHFLFGSCIFVSSSLNLILPVTITKGHYTITCLIRLLQGLSEGLLFPSSYAILWHWTPSKETSRLGALVLTGMYLGALVGLPVSGFITAMFGWTYVYYVYGVTAIVWVVLWVLFSYDRPENHPSISVKEAQLLNDTSMHKIGPDEKIPVKDIITSVPVLVLCFCNFAFFLLYTNEPVYINIYGYQLDQTSFYASLPHLLLALSSFSSGFLADFMHEGQRMSVTLIRKFFTCFGFGVEALCFLMLAFIDDPTVAIVTLSIGVGFSGFTVAGWQINHLDLAPRYGSVIIGISSSFGALAGIISSVSVGYITGDQTIGEWQKVFAIFAAIISVAVVLYGTFSSGELQPWGEAPSDPAKDAQISPEADLLQPPHDPVSSQRPTSPSDHPKKTAGSYNTMDAN